MLRPIHIGFRNSSKAVLLGGGLLATAIVAAGCAKNGVGTSDNRTINVTSHAAKQSHETEMFAGVKAKTGHAIHAHDAKGRSTLTLSDDFKVPDAPAPHWQVVDSKGNAYLLQRLVIKGDKLNKTITVPAYVGDVAKVQIWCAYAEVLLGEASFSSPVQ